MNYILTIAGSDSMGGAGIQADIRTITALGSHALMVISAITAQNSLAVKQVYALPSHMIVAQIEAVLEDVMPDSVKIGMLGSVEALDAVARCLERFAMGPVVLDPVLKASSGSLLFDPQGLAVMRQRLLPLVDVVTPNLDEAQALAEMEINDLGDMAEAARKIKKTGPDVIITGGHMEGDAIDLLFYDEHARFFKAGKLDNFNSHGTGCVFSSALATYLASGKALVEATKLAKDFTRYAIINSYECGKGPGPVNPDAWRAKQILE